MAEKLAPEKRHVFVHNGQKVFEWDQTLEEVNIYINLPPNVHPKQFYCKIQSKHVEVGIRPILTFILLDSRSRLFYTVCQIQHRNPLMEGGCRLSISKSEEEDGIVHIFLQKRDKAQTWSSPIQGQGQLDPYTSDLEQKRLMLQRFQEENPGFDFSQGQFSGSCPDPRTFMGGIRSS